MNATAQKQTQTEMSEDLNPKKRGLGRGLNALFEDEEVDYAPKAEAAQAAPETAAAESAGKSRQMLGIDLLAPRKEQPRKIFYDETLRELADSIKRHGVLQPLLVRPAKDNPGNYEIIAGERRWRAAQLAGQHEVPVIHMEVSEEEAFRIALIENLQREDLDILDEANGYQAMIDTFGYTQEQLAEALGKSRSHVTNMLRLRKLPDAVLLRLHAGHISMGHARALLGASNPGDLVDFVVEQELTVRQTEELIADGHSAHLQKPRVDMADKRGGNGRKMRDANLTAIEETLAQKTGLKVHIAMNASGKSGTFKIDFKSLDQLDQILEYLGGEGSAKPAARLMD